MVLLTLATFNNYAWPAGINIVPNLITSLMKMAAHPSLLFTLFTLNFFLNTRVLLFARPWALAATAAAIYSAARSHHYFRNTYHIGVNVGLENTLAYLHPPMLFVSVLGVSYVLLFGAAGKRNPSTLFTAKQYFWLTLSFALSCLWAYQELFWGSFWNWDPVEFSYLLLLMLGGLVAHTYLRPFSARTRVLAAVSFVTGVYILRLINISPLAQSVHSFSNAPIGFWGAPILRPGLFACCLLFALAVVQLSSDLSRTPYTVSGMLNPVAALVAVCYIGANVIHLAVPLRAAILGHQTFQSLFIASTVVLLASVWGCTPAPRVRVFDKKLPPLSHWTPISCILSLCGVWYVRNTIPLYDTLRSAHHGFSFSVSTLEFCTTTNHSNTLYYFSSRYLSGASYKHKHMQGVAYGNNLFVTARYNGYNSRNTLFYLSNKPF